MTQTLVEGLHGGRILVKMDAIIAAPILDHLFLEETNCAGFGKRLQYLNLLFLYRRTWRATESALT